MQSNRWKVSLVKLIKNIQNDIFYKAEYKIAIVTDHGLENIEKINKRDLPIIDNEWKNIERRSYFKFSDFKIIL